MEESRPVRPDAILAARPAHAAGPRECVPRHRHAPPAHHTGADGSRSFRPDRIADPTNPALWAGLWNFRAVGAHVVAPHLVQGGRWNGRWDIRACGAFSPALNRDEPTRLARLWYFRASGNFSSTPHRYAPGRWAGLKDFCTSGADVVAPDPNALNGNSISLGKFGFPVIRKHDRFGSERAPKVHHPIAQPNGLGFRPHHPMRPDRARQQCRNRYPAS